MKSSIGSILTTSSTSNMTWDPSKRSTAHWYSLLREHWHYSIVPCFNLSIKCYLRCQWINNAIVRYKCNIKLITQESGPHPQSLCLYRMWLMLRVHGKSSIISELISHTKLYWHDLLWKRYEPTNFKKLIESINHRHWPTKGSVVYKKCNGSANNTLMYKTF
jgi:hypothetical protein